jgi:hypothetical protein
VERTVIGACATDKSCLSYRDLVLPDFLPVRGRRKTQSRNVQRAMGNKSSAPRKAELFVSWCLLKSSGSRGEKVIHIVDEDVHILLIESGKKQLDKHRLSSYTTSSARGLRSSGVVPESSGWTARFLDATESLGCMRSARARPDLSGQRSAIHRPDEETTASASAEALVTSPDIDAPHHPTALLRKRRSPKGVPGGDVTPP